MSEIKVASRYAKSMIDLAIEQNSLDKVYADMQLTRDVLRANSNLRAVISNPIVSAHDKLIIMDKVFSGKVSTVTDAFFKIMINKGRHALIYQTTKEFYHQYNQLKGILTAKVSSTTELTNDAKNYIINLVKETTKANQVILETTINPDLIGGFVLTVGDKQFDTSIQKTLRVLSKELATNQYVSSI